MYMIKSAEENYKIRSVLLLPLSLREAFKKREKLTIDIPHLYKQIHILNTVLHLWNVKETQ